MNNNEWEFSSPAFESDIINPKLKAAYWEGHRYFVYDLIKFIKPKKMLELGSQYGCSLFSFCQSVKDNNLDTEINAVDRWKGDIEAEHTGEEVFEIVNKTKDKYFSALKINLFQMDFDDALPSFQDNSIDIIHIDGGHRFEDVDHDLKTWLPKLKENGIILFHDVFSHIDRGSCDHWEMIKEKYEYHFEYKHSCGLGILFPKGNLLYKKIENARFFKYFYNLYKYKSLYEYTDFRFKELSDLYVERYKVIENQSEMIKERDDVIKGQEKLIEERLNAINKQSEMIKERDNVIKGQEKLIEERLCSINKQSEMIKERDNVIKECDNAIKQRDEIIQQRDKLISEKEEIIQNQSKLIEERLDAINEQSKMIEERDNYIIELKAMVNKGRIFKKKI